MKLFFSPGACALATQIVLRELGQKFDLVKVDLKTKNYDGGDYKKINPKGYVPALQLDNGEVLTEGSVIMQWLADQNPGKNLIPKLGTPERYKAMEWLNFVATEIHKGFSPMFNADVSADAKKVLSERLLMRIDYLNNHLAKSPWMLGNDFSVVDAYVYNIMRWTTPLKIDISHNTALLGFMEKMSTRPTVRAAIEAEGLKH